MHSSEGAELGCRPRSVGLQTLHSSHCLWRRNREGSTALTLPVLPTLCTYPGGSRAAGQPPQSLTASLAPTAPYHFPSLHTKARLPSPYVLQSQGRILRVQPSKLVGTKALSATGKALMTLPTAKVMISLPPNSDVKMAPSIQKSRKVGLDL